MSIESLPLSKATGEVVGILMGDFLQRCVGKNDMAIVNGLITTAVILTKAHCDRTGQDFDETLDLSRALLEAAANVLRERR